MSSNFEEIIKKLHFFARWKAHQRATHAAPHLSASCYGKCEPQVRDLLAGITCGGGGEGGVISETVPFVNG
jgi:hypothetical protein